MGRTRTSAILVAFLFSACSSNEHGAVGEPPPGGSSTQDAGVTDAGATDAGTDLADRPFTPSVTSVPPFLCPTIDVCQDSKVSYSLVFETEPSIELREARNNRVLAYDTPKKQFVVYELSVGMSDDKIIVTQRRRFDPRYDRVLAGTNEWMLGCQRSSCDLLSPDYEQESPTHVPDEVHATVIDGHCVGGMGIACYDDASKTWNWPLRPNDIDHPVVTFAYLGGEAFVVSDGRTLFVIDQGHRHELAMAPDDPVLSIDAGWYFKPQRWAGRTASGKLVLGSYGEAIICDASVVSAKVDYVAMLMIQQNAQIILGGSNNCVRLPVPASMLGMDSIACGITAEPFAFDAHRIYAPPVKCLLD